MSDPATTALFPIMSVGYRHTEEVPKLRREGVPALIVGLPWAMIASHERQAQANHGQSLRRLAERGGLGPCEAVAVLEDRRWHKMSSADAQRQLASLLDAHLVQARRASEAAKAGGITEAQFAQQVAFMASECAHWSGDMLGPHSDGRLNEPASLEMVARFLSKIRCRCDVLEQWAASAPSLSDVTDEAPIALISAAEAL